jgi:hypothetical protein
MRPGEGGAAGTSNGRGGGGGAFSAGSVRVTALGEGGASCGIGNGETFVIKGHTEVLVTDDSDRIAIPKFSPMKLSFEVKDVDPETIRIITGEIRTMQYIQSSGAKVTSDKLNAAIVFLQDECDISIDRLQCSVLSEDCESYTEIKAWVARQFGGPPPHQRCYENLYDAVLDALTRLSKRTDGQRDETADRLDSISERGDKIRSVLATIK